MDISADLIYSRRLSAVLRKDEILFLFFKGGTTVVVIPVIGVAKTAEAVFVIKVGVAGATRLTNVIVKAVTKLRGNLGRR